MQRQHNVQSEVKRGVSILLVISPPYVIMVVKCHMQLWWLINTLGVWEVWPRGEETGCATALPIVSLLCGMTPIFKILRFENIHFLKHFLVVGLTIQLVTNAGVASRVYFIWHKAKT